MKILNTTLNRDTFSNLKLKSESKLRDTDEFDVDFSKIDNSLEFSLLPFNDAYVMSKVLQKLKEQKTATIEGKLDNLDMKLVFSLVSTKSNINTYIVRVSGNIGDNEIKSDLFLTEGTVNENLKNQVTLKNLGVINNNSFLVNALWSETFDQWGFQKLSTSNVNNDSSQLTLTYNPENPEEFYYKVKQDCTCTKEIVEATYISTSSNNQNKNEAKMKMTLSQDLTAEGTIKNNSKKIKFNYQIK